MAWQVFWSQAVSSMGAGDVAERMTAPLVTLASESPAVPITAANTNSTSTGHGSGRTDQSLQHVPAFH